MVADPVRLKQILSNLLSNAVKLTPEGRASRMGAVYHSTHVRSGLELDGEEEWGRRAAARLVGEPGLEPGTPCL